MPTDSTADATAMHARARRRRAVSALAAALALLPAAGPGCSLRRAVVVDDLFAPLSREAARLPSPTDLASARLARAALVSSSAPAASDAERQAVAAAFAELERVASRDGAPDGGPHASGADSEADAKEAKRVVTLATDLRNATLDDPIADRAASRALRKRRGLDPRLRARLDTLIGEDPLHVARRRQQDDWHRLFARTFNSVAEPLGQSVITGFILAPYHLANSLIHYFAEFSNAEPLSTTDRQALVLREQFLAAHPESAVAPKVERLVARDRPKLEKTLAKRRLRAAEAALDAGAAGLALHQARAVGTILAPHPEANTRLRAQGLRLAERAQAELDRQAALARRSLEARATAPATRTSEIALASALLARAVPPGDGDPLLARFRADAGRAGLGRGEFVEAIAQHEAGREQAERRTLGALAGARDARDPMTRHARQLLDDEWQNPYDAWRRLRRSARREALAFRLAGEWVNRPRYPNLWRPVAYLIDTPAIAMTIVMAPIRALISPFTGFPDFQRATSLAGYRYLLLHPQGEHQREVVDWLYDYEKGEEHWGRALRLADLIPDLPAKERSELVEETAEEQLGQLDRLDRRDQRASVLRGVATEFPDAEGGRDAGLRAREELRDASPQHIRITRGFLLENPAVAGDGGLGLDPTLLNGDPRDGELHADGVVLRGGRVIEILLRPEGRDEDAKPESRIRQISPERLARLTTALGEAVQRNSLIDEQARFAPDANRETYLEQARLGLTDDADARPTAESSFVYQSLRERYGLVRGRDSVLPFDLVFRGSLGDFSLGAFPRWRPPRETDDAFLYR